MNLEGPPAGGPSSRPATVRVAKGLDVPYPTPTSEAASKIGRANRRTGTRCELLLRSELHRRGLRFRVDHLIRAGAVKAHADIAFTRKRVAVFVDDCFWHGCPEHCHVPKTNLSYWIPKLEANRARDVRVVAALEEDGWQVLRFWEHVPAAQAADVVESLVRRRA